MAVVTTTKTKPTKEVSEMDEFIEVLKLLKDSNPEVDKVLESLVQADQEIRVLHLLKLDHREGYFTLGEHCEWCRQWTYRQEKLRKKRTELMERLYWLSYGMNPEKLYQTELVLMSRPVPEVAERERVKA